MFGRLLSEGLRAAAPVISDVAQGAFSANPYQNFAPADYARPDPYDSQFSRVDMAASAPPGDARALTGRRKALLIGINYTNSRNPLRGCWNDVDLMRGFIQRHGFTDITVLTDRPENGMGPMCPTKDNMIAAMRWLTTGAAAGDSLFFHYSGHGAQERDTTGDEKDGMDETIVPVNFETAGMIDDDMLYTILVKDLPRTCRLTAVMDCCHSGTVLDLPFVFQASERVMANWMSEIPSMVTNINFSAKGLVQLGVGVFKLYKKAKASGGFAGGGGGGAAPPSGDGYSDAGGKTVQGEVILFSGCMDSQTSADVADVGKVFSMPPGPGGAGGACTTAMISALGGAGSMSFIELLDGMRKSLAARGFEQVVQLSTSAKVDLRVPFSFDRLVT